jgi:hypothetical protein
LPVDFNYWVFAVLLFLTGCSMAAFGSPNRAGVMNSLPPEHRGAGSGMNTTFQNSAQVFSIGIFFTLIVVGLSSSLPQSLTHGLVQHQVPVATARHVANLPPVSTLFAAFLGYNPVQNLIGSPTLHHLPIAQQSALLGHTFFPTLITPPFRQGLHAALDFAIVASLLAAAASWTRGKQYFHDDTVNELQMIGDTRVASARTGSTTEPPLPVSLQRSVRPDDPPSAVGASPG